MKGKLEKVKNGKAMRTDTIVGEAHSIPKLGKQFVLMSEPLDPSAQVLVFTTTDVRNVTVESSGAWVFETQNSTYRFTPTC